MEQSLSNLREIRNDLDQYASAFAVADEVRFQETKDAAVKYFMDMDFLAKQIKEDIRLAKNVSLSDEAFDRVVSLINSFQRRALEAKKEIINANFENRDDARLALLNLIEASEPALRELRTFSQSKADLSSETVSTRNQPAAGASMLQELFRYLLTTRGGLGILYKVGSFILCIPLFFYLMYKDPSLLNDVSLGLFGKQEKSVIRQAQSAEDVPIWSSINSKDNLYDKKKVLSLVSDEVSHHLSLPKKINYSFSDCKHGSSFFDLREDVSVGLCYSKLSDISEQMRKKSETETEENKEIAQIEVAKYFLYREVGKVLVNLLRLPVVEVEEEKDEFAVWFFALNNKCDNALYASRYFSSVAGSRSGDSRRFFNIACLVYGSDPANYAYLVSDDILPAKNLSSCVQAYQQVDKRWRKLLQPYIRNGN